MELFPDYKGRNTFNIWLIALMAITVLITSSFFSKSATAAPNRKYASIVMDADTGVILHQRYADKVLHPASLTKMMTLVLLFDALEQRQLRLNDRIRVSERAARMIPSKLDIPAGETIRVKDAIYALVTKSANDIAVAIAERTAGSEDRFAAMMTRKAHTIGMTRTKFTNASGLHDPNQVSTARDMAKLGRYIINKYPDFYRIFSTRNFTYQGNTYNNHNRLMRSYQGMDGIKTGYVRASGFNLVASATRNNRRLIGVVFGGRSAATRNRHMAILLDRGFARLEEIRMAQAKLPLPGRKPDTVSIAAAMNEEIQPAAGAAKWASLNPALSQGMIGLLIGEGDYDPAQTRRFETGMIAIAAHKGEALPDKALVSPVIVKASLGREVGKQLANHFHNRKPTAEKKFAFNTYNHDIKPITTSGRWAVQIGAFGSRVRTDQVLSTALQSLPKNLAGASARIAPLHTGDQLLYRARLEGYSKSEALRACQYFRDCITIAPGEY